MNGLKIGGKALIWRSLVPENVGKIVTITGFAGAGEIIQKLDGIWVRNKYPCALIEERVCTKIIKGSHRGKLITVHDVALKYLLPLWEEDEDQKIEEEAEA